MRKIMLFSIFLLGFCITVQAQLEPVNWTYQAKEIGNDEYEVVFTAEVADGWYIYSQYLDDGGPIPTSFVLDKEEAIQSVGKVKEKGNKKEGFDNLFEMNVIKYSGKTTFTQRIKTNGSVDEITGYLTFMTCNDESCLPPKDIDFAIMLP